MSNEEIRRRRTSDPELDAINVVNQALEGLTRSQAERVLKWAEARFVREEILMEKDSMEAVNKFMGGLAECARRLNTDGETVLKAIARTADAIGPRDGDHAEVPTPA